MAEDINELWWLTGPNGSGRTTLASRILPVLNARRVQQIEYFNPGEAAENLPHGWLDAQGSFNAIRYGAGGRKSYLVEMTVPKDIHYEMTAAFREQGCKIGIIAVGVAHNAIAQANIDERIASGDHTVLPLYRASSFEACRHNTPKFLGLADEAHLYNNTDSGTFAEVASRSHGEGYVLHVPEGSITIHHPYFLSVIDEMSKLGLMAKTPEGMLRHVPKVDNCL